MFSFNKNLDSPNPDPFNPYDDNGGTVVAIAGEDFAVIGADSRLKSGLTINTRDQKKLLKLSEHAVLGSVGCGCDILTFTKLVKSRILIYEYEQDRVMSTPAIAQMLSTMLYYKRFFPYYIFNVLAGLDPVGKGCVYGYDPVGHCERCKYHASGSAGAHLQPLLDNQIGHSNMQNVQEVPLTINKAVAIVKDAFTCAAERDVSTRDSVYIHTITANGVQEEKFDLRKD